MGQKMKEIMQKLWKEYDLIKFSTIKTQKYSAVFTSSELIHCFWFIKIIILLFDELHNIFLGFVFDVSDPWIVLFSLRLVIKQVIA